MSSIFLSHNSIDTAFVQKLVNDLRRNGYYALFGEEAEMNISDQINRVQHIGLIVSRNSINSEWVKKNVDIALNQEVESKKVNVLPIVVENVELPDYLAGKLFADFTTEEKYKSGLQLIMDTMDEIPADVEGKLSPQKARELIRFLGPLGQQIDITRHAKRVLLERLAVEKKELSEDLISTIVNEQGLIPELDDINRNYAFICEEIDITAGYVLYGIEKEYKRGGTYQIAMFCKLNNKHEELALLIDAIVRRLRCIALK